MDNRNSSAWAVETTTAADAAAGTTATIATAAAVAAVAVAIVGHKSIVNHYVLWKYRWSNRAAKEEGTE